MGMDLIGYLVKGPVRAEKDEVDRRAYFDERKIPFFESMVLDTENTRGESAPPLDDPSLEPDQLQVLGEEFEDFLASFDAFSQACDEFEAFWNSERGRDTCFRLDPDDENQKFLFTGDMSFGETPDGTGFRAMERATEFRLFDLYNIR